MANVLCNVGLSLSFSKFLGLPLPVTVIHLSSSFSPPFGAYPPQSAVRLMSGLDATSSLSHMRLLRGLDATSSLLHIDLKWCLLYFLNHQS